MKARFLLSTLAAALIISTSTLADVLTPKTESVSGDYRLVRVAAEPLWPPRGKEKGLGPFKLLAAFRESVPAGAWSVGASAMPAAKPLRERDARLTADALKGRLGWCFGDGTTVNPADGRVGRQIEANSTRTYRLPVSADGERIFALGDPITGERHPVRAGKSPVVERFPVGGKRSDLVWTASVQALGGRESYSALLKAGDRLCAGGGKREGTGGFVKILDSKTGQLLATHDLPSRVIECGMAATPQAMFISCEGGELVCLAGGR